MSTIRSCTLALGLVSIGRIQVGAERLGRAGPLPVPGLPGPGHFGAGRPGLFRPNARPASVRYNPGRERGERVMSLGGRSYAASTLPNPDDLDRDRDSRRAPRFPDRRAPGAWCTP